jgi:RNA polymerase sigma-70 factor (ECF subfamily)
MFSLDAVKPYAARVNDWAADGEDDAALARRILACVPARDPSAEAALCRRLGPRIRLFALKHLRNEAAAADLAQDVLILLLTKLREGAIRDPGQVVSFVLGSARQMVVDGRRTSARRGRILEAFQLDVLPSEEDAPEALDTTRLGRCLAALPERERAVLVMTFYDDRPADAVASELGIKAGNVRVIRHRGLERLRDCMHFAGEPT